MLFTIFFVFVILPLCGILLLLWLVTQKQIFGKIFGYVSIGTLGLILLGALVRFLTTKKRVTKADIYGSYIIDRTKFPGKQADWQYEHFRFEITSHDELIFHQTDGREILASDTAKIEFLEQYANDRIRIITNSRMHHIIDIEPTLYRKVWSFYYVFYSPKFGNVFFTKGKWKPLK